MPACTRLLLNWMGVVYYWMLRYVRFVCVQDSFYHIWLCWRTGNWYIASRFAQVGEWCGRVSHINLKWERKLKSIVLMFVFPVGVTPFLTTLLFSVHIFCKDICQGLVFVWLQILYGSWKPFLSGFQKLRNWLSMCEKFFAGTVNCLSLGCFIFNDCKPNGAYRISCCGLLYKFIGERHWKMLLMCNNAWITFAFL